MKKLIVVFAMGLAMPVMGGQTYTNSSLKKYDSYKSENSVQRSSVQYTSSSTSSSSTHSYSPVAGEKRHRAQIRQVERELREVNKKIREIERKIQFHKKIRTPDGDAKGELRSLRNRKVLIQSQLDQPRSPSGSVGATSSVIECTVDGDFEGWEGETIVKLMNGQIWQQTQYHYCYHYAYMPKVLVYNSGGGWKMKVEGTDTAVGVMRLR